MIKLKYNQSGGSPTESGETPESSSYVEALNKLIFKKLSKGNESLKQKIKEQAKKKREDELKLMDTIQARLDRRRRTKPKVVYEFTKQNLVKVD